MSQPSAYEQYLLELINAERAKTGAQALAFDGALNDAADNHNAWMIATDSFSHTGSGGSSSVDRVRAAGYVLDTPWTVAENIANATTRSPTGYQDEVFLLHNGLMNSPGHKANILNGSFREVGVSYQIGEYAGREYAWTTEDFVKSGSSIFLTGVAYSDTDKDNFYDPGEGLGGLGVSAVSTSGGQTFSTTTMDAGGYDLVLSSGSYNVTFSGSGFASWTQHITIAGGNVKLDLVNPATATNPPPSPPPPPPPPPPQQNEISGTANGDTLNGTAGADHIKGLLGADKLNGNDGNDSLEGNEGADTLAGGAGNDALSGDKGADLLIGGAGSDLLTGGLGADRFQFDAALSASTNVDTIADFNVTDDTILLENAVFTSLKAGGGGLWTEAFYIGSAAHDANDRIIYNQTSGALLYDPDGTGGAAATQFATVAAGLAMTSADFLII